jgi:hypothetical protein
MDIGIAWQNLGVLHLKSEENLTSVTGSDTMSQRRTDMASTSDTIFLLCKARQQVER